MIKNKLFQIVINIQKLLRRYYHHEILDIQIIYNINKNSSDPLLLEIGGGETPEKKHLKYLNFDLRKLPQVDIVGRAIELDQFFDESVVNSIYGRHFLEHLSYPELDLFFIAACKVLCKTNGFLEFKVPDLWYHIAQLTFFSPDDDQYSLGVSGLHGWQRDGHKTYWDVHKCSFDQEIIKRLGKKYGFKTIFIRSHPKEIHFVFQK